MADIDWNLARVFLAALAERSLSGAARVLGVAQPTVSRQIAELEAQLGVALFTRSPRGLHPTPEALRLAPHARAMAAAAAHLSRTAFARDAAPEGGVVRISASEIIGVHVLPRLLSGFRREHPQVVMELSLCNRLEDLLGGDVDLAVRMVRPTQGQLVARRIGAVGLGLYAHRDYLAEHAAPATLAQLQGHALIGFDHASAFLRRIMHDLPFDREDFSLRCDSDLAQLAAVRGGVGIGFVQHPLAARSPRLAPVLGDTIGFELPLWLTMHEDQRRTPRIRQLFEHLASGLTRYLAGDTSDATSPPSE
jgi:DNA-binding transcriptional LysR family regulator